MKNTFSDCEKQPAPNGGGGGGSGGDNGDAGGGGVGVGLKCLVTAGPTREFFDPVRYISNPSSGKMGYAIAAAAADVGCAVSLVSGPVALAAPTGVALRNVITGAEMLAATGELFGECDILIMAAAVCDFRPKHRALAKVKKENVPLSADFESVPDILKTLSARKRVGQTLVGFAAETDDIENYALRKLVAKNLDLIVANQVGYSVGAGNAFGADDNRVVLLGRGGFRLAYGPAPKADVAHWLIARILAHHRPAAQP